MSKEKSIFEKKGGMYRQVGEYLIPDIICKSGEQMEQLGKYGFLRRDYLKNYRNSRYQVMLMRGTIGAHLLEVDKTARELEMVIIKQLEEKEPLRFILIELKYYPEELFQENKQWKSKTTVDNTISFLRERGLIERIGSNKAGYWKVND